MNKYFFLHIPKTAGNFFNKFLSRQFNDFIDHIEVKIDFKKEDEIEKLRFINCFSGHISLPMGLNKLDLKNRKIITIFRIPIEQVISHITFVRELAEPSEKKRFSSHNKAIQEIAMKLKKTDLSSPQEIENLIKWLEDNKIWLFHDCQTRYLGGGVEFIKPQNLNAALENLEKIDYVGITERLKEFMILLSMEENFKLIEYQKENVTKNRYGLNINNINIRKALQPLIQNDHIIYKFARKKFIVNFYQSLYNFEIKKGPRYSAIRVDMLFNELRRKDV